MKKFIVTLAILGSTLTFANPHLPHSIQCFEKGDSSSSVSINFSRGAGYHLFRTDGNSLSGVETIEQGKLTIVNHSRRSLELEGNLGGSLAKFQMDLVNETLMIEAGLMDSREFDNCNVSYEDPMMNMLD